MWENFKKHENNLDTYSKSNVDTNMFKFFQVLKIIANVAVFTITFLKYK